jgi:hypothetical protein
MYSSPLGHQRPVSYVPCPAQLRALCYSVTALYNVHAPSFGWDTPIDGYSVVKIHKIVLASMEIYCICSL